MEATAIAFRDAERIAPQLNRNARWHLDDLTNGRRHPYAIALIELTAEGRVPSEWVPPAGIELERGDVDAGPTPAMAWLQDARQSRLRGSAPAAIRAIQNGLDSLESERSFVAASLRLEKARALEDLGRFDEAIETLEQLLAWPELAQLGGRSLHEIVYTRLASAATANHDDERAAGVRHRFLEAVLAGRLPMRPAEMRVALDHVLLEGIESSRRAEAIAFIDKLEMAAEIDRALVATPGARWAHLQGDQIALFDEEHRYCQVFARDDLRAMLDETSHSVAPLMTNGLALVDAADVGDRAKLVALDREAWFGDERWLVVDRPEAYAWVAATRNRAVWIGAAIVLLTLGFTAFWGVRALGEQERLNELRSAFVASVSHELRTPAASIHLMAENLASGAVADESRRSEYYEHLRAESDRLRLTVANALDASRVERGRFEVQLQPTDIANWAENLCERSRTRLAGAGIAFEPRISAERETADIDPLSLERAIANLIDNVVRHAVHPSHVRLDLSCDAGELCIRVLDDGADPPERPRPNLLQPFARGATTSATGAGLGLAIVDEAARAHHGAVELGEGLDGRGFGVTLSIPLESEIT